jgi:hypothetical protein
MAMIQQGVYKINPDLISMGGTGGRMDILIRYRDVEDRGVPETKVQEIEKEIERLEQEIAALKARQGGAAAKTLPAFKPRDTVKNGGCW